MRLAVIPARGGSKRIPKKNIRSFHGKPIIAWSIEVALESGCFDKIIVSTDDEEIMEVARATGAEVPFVRPANLSDDYTPTLPVVKHAVDWVNQNIGPVRWVCCLYATAPFIQAQALRDGFDKLSASQADYCFSATSFPFPIQRAMRLTANDHVEMFCPEQIAARSQDLEDAYHDAGQFYWGTAEAWMEERPIFSPTARALILPRHLVQDIDTLEDWRRAELMFRLLRQDMTD